MCICDCFVVFDTFYCYSFYILCICISNTQSWWQYYDNSGNINYIGEFSTSNSNTNINPTINPNSTNNDFNIKIATGNSNGFMLSAGIDIQPRRNDDNSNVDYGNNMNHNNRDKVKSCKNDSKNGSSNHNTVVSDNAK